jgi:hypothetical protein
MTKKDYELIARVLRDTEAACLRSQWDAVWRDRSRVAIAMADELAAVNPRFKRDVFLRACGVES